MIHKRVIAAYAGTGKTTAAERYPGAVVDFVSMPYKYILCPLPPGAESEAGKAEPENVLRGGWPWNYVDALQEFMEEGKVLLIPPDPFVLRLLRAKRIPYTLCYPRKSAKETLSDILQKLIPLHGGHNPRITNEYS